MSEVLADFLPDDQPLPFSSSAPSDLVGFDYLLDFREDEEALIGDTSNPVSPFNSPQLHVVDDEFQLSRNNSSLEILADWYNDDGSLLENEDSLLHGFRFEGDLDAFVAGLDFKTDDDDTSSTYSFASDATTLSSCTHHSSLHDECAGELNTNPELSHVASSSSISSSHASNLDDTEAAEGSWKVHRLEEPDLKCSLVFNKEVATALEKKQTERLKKPIKSRLLKSKSVCSRSRFTECSLTESFTSGSTVSADEAARILKNKVVREQWDKSNSYGPYGVPHTQDSLIFRKAPYAACLPLTTPSHRKNLSLRENEKSELIGGKKKYGRGTKELLRTAKRQQQRSQLQSKLSSLSHTTAVFKESGKSHCFCCSQAEKITTVNSDSHHGRKRLNSKGENTSKNIAKNYIGLKKSKVHRQLLKEKKSGLFAQEQVVRLSSSWRNVLVHSEDDDVDIIG